MAMNPVIAQAIEKYAVLAARYYFGAHTFISGINHYLLFFPDPLPMKPEMTGRFMTVLVDSGMYDVCKGIEIVAGLLLLLGRWVPLALILEAPVTMIIFYLSIYMTGSPRTVFTGWREAVLNFGLLAAYWGYFRPIFFQPNLPLKPFWRDPMFGGKP
jgi:putative oxidoreductase